MTRTWGANLRLFKAAVIVVLAFSGSAFLTAARADAVKMLGNIGDANKASGLITHYSIHPETHSLDVIAATPLWGVNEKVIRQVAVETAHDICANGRVGGWTLRMFLPGESMPITTCRFGGRH